MRGARVHGVPCGMRGARVCGAQVCGARVCGARVWDVLSADAWCAVRDAWCAGVWCADACPYSWCAERAGCAGVWCAERLRYAGSAGAGCVERGCMVCRAGCVVCGCGMCCVSSVRVAQARVLIHGVPSVSGARVAWVRVWDVWSADAWCADRLRYAGSAGVGCVVRGCGMC